MITELLSPAGNFESLRAAVENGADAVYLGGRLFNARQYASNFDDEQFEQALDYAHLKNVRVYLTLNTLLMDDELQPALEYTNRAYEMGIDAVITQDIGFADALHSQIPGLPLHASTQMTTYNKEGVRLLESLGFERIVLARELSLKEIADIKNNTGIPLEIFIHGALCVCYSGQCLLSSAIGCHNGNRGASSVGGRSGNRGTCAQPCRLKYKLLNPEGKTLDYGHLLSTRDICSIDFLKELVDMKIASLKIEGRMKSPEYVGTVTSKYRKALDFITGISDNPVTPSDKKDLIQIFNRGGLSKGYFYGKNNSLTVFKEKPKNLGTPLGTLISYNHATLTATVKLTGSIFQGDGIEILADSETLPGGIVTGIVLDRKFVKEAHSGRTAELSRINADKGISLKKGLEVIKTSDKRLNTEISATYRESANLKKTPVSMTFIFQKNIPMEISLRAGGVETNVKSDFYPQDAKTTGLSCSRLKDQLYKTDVFPFYINSLDIHMDDGLFAPVSEINKLRRRAFELISDKITKSYKKVSPVLKPVIKSGVIPDRESKISVSAMFFNEDTLSRQSDAVLNFLDRIILPLEFFKKNHPLIEVLKDKGIIITALIPGIFKGTNYKAAYAADEYMIGTLGALDFAKSFGKPVCGDFGLNVYNSLTILALKNTGIKRLVLSPELSGIRDIPLAKELDIFVYGKYPVMISKFCPVGAYFGQTPCKGAGNRYYLSDKMDEKYPILCHNIGCCPEILSSKPVDHIKNLDELKHLGHRNFRINVFDEQSDELEEILWQIKR